MNPSRPDRRPLVRRRKVLLAVGSACAFVWLVIVADNYLVHIPYAWGLRCMPCYSFYNGMYVDVADPGLVAALFFLVSLACLALLWAPWHGPRTALLRVVLIVAPACLLAYEVGVYFLLSYWWPVHATIFLTGTVFTNEAVFWISAVLLAAGLAAGWISKAG